jgi:hypothetical protein
MGPNGIIHRRYPLQAGSIVYLNPVQRPHVTTGYGVPEHCFVQETAPYHLFQQQYRAWIMKIFGKPQAKKTSPLIGER